MIIHRLKTPVIRSLPEVKLSLPKKQFIPRISIPRIKKPPVIKIIPVIIPEVKVTPVIIPEIKATPTKVELEFIRVLWGDNLKDSIFNELKYCTKYEKDFNAQKSKILVYGEENFKKVKSLTDNEVILIDKDSRPFKELSHWFLKLYAIQQALIMFKKPIIFLDLDTFHVKPFDDNFFKYFSGNYYGNFRDSFQMPIYFFRRWYLNGTSYKGKFGNRVLNASFIYCKDNTIIDRAIKFFKETPAKMILSEEFIITLMLTEQFGDLETTELAKLTEPEVIRIHKGLDKKDIYLTHHPMRKLKQI